MGTLTQVLPYGHSFSIVSPCNGATVESFARIKNIDGLTNAVATVSALERVGMDGTLYTGSTPQFKTISIVIDLSDDRIKWVDVYSFFNKCVSYRLVFDNYYIYAAISQIKRNFFSVDADEMTVTLECGTPYWMRDFVVNHILRVNATTPTRFNVSNAYGIVEAAASFSFAISDLSENTVTGFRLAPVDSSLDKYVYDVQGMSSLYTPVEGATWTFRPNIDSFLTSSYLGRSLQYELVDYPDVDKRFYLGKEYEFSLYQGVGNTDVVVTLTATGTIRSYM